MRKFCTFSTVCAFISVFLLTSPAIADSKLIESMNITGGTVIWANPGGTPEEIIFSSFGANTNLVGGYIGVGGSTSEPFEPPDPDNIIFFTIFGGLNNVVVTYTAASNLGSSGYPADLIPGGPVPTGTLDDDLNTIQMDLSSWFGNLNNGSDIWAGTGLDDGFTSPLATGIWNPVTFEYELSWNSMVPPDNAFVGTKSYWTLTGHAYPVTTVFIAIDIKPGSDQNTINLGSSGVIPVAILSTADFNALTVDPTSVSLAGASVRLVGKSDNYLCFQKDVNVDGLLDIVCQVYTAQFMVEEGSTIAVLEAETFDGTKLRGEDYIRIMPDN